VTDSGPDATRDDDAGLRRARRYRRWRLGPADVASAVSLVLLLLLLTTPAWRMALAAAVFVAAGWAVLKLLDRRDDAGYLAAVELLDAPESEDFRYQAAGRVPPRRAEARVESWQEQVRTWLDGAPPAAADDAAYEVIDAGTLAGALGESSAHVGRRPDYEFAWTPFPADHARSIVRVWPDRMVGSVYRTADGDAAVRWQPPDMPERLG
jgi:hypothetical protein